MTRSLMYFLAASVIVSSSCKRCSMVSRLFCVQVSLQFEVIR